VVSRCVAFRSWGAQSCLSMKLDPMKLDPMKLEKLGSWEIGEVTKSRSHEITNPHSASALAYRIFTDYKIPFALSSSSSFLSNLIKHDRQLNNHFLPLPGGGMRLLLIRHGETVDNVAGI